MSRTANVKSAIRSELLRQGPCPLEALHARLPQFSWCEVFSVVDQLSREGQLILRHPTRFHYEVSLGQTRSTSDHTLDGAAAGHASEPVEQCVTL